MKPEARRKDLLLQDFGDELVIYDQERHRAHYLNRTAALVWLSCDGQKGITELTRLLENELDTAINDVVTWQALNQLQKAQLLREPITPSAPVDGISRRQVLRKLSRTAALAFVLPVVTTIIAPTPIRADDDFACDELPCSDYCKDLCRTDADCPSDSPLCRLLPCNSQNCAGCMQRRCDKQKTPHQIQPTDP